jgi:hypothetical protein
MANLKIRESERYWREKYEQNVKRCTQLASQHLADRNAATNKIMVLKRTISKMENALAIMFGINLAFAALVLYAVMFS